MPFSDISDLVTALRAIEFSGKQVVKHTEECERLSGFHESMLADVKVDESK